MPTYFIGYPAPLRRFDEFIEEPYKPIPLNQRHLTLLYLGHLRNREKKMLVDKAERGPVKIGVIEVCFKSLEAYPSRAKPRYIAVIPTPGCVAKLHKVRKVLGYVFGVYVKDRYEEFRPHVSIAYTRCKPSLELQEKALKIVKKCRGVEEKLILRKLCLFKAEKGFITPIFSFG